MFCNYDYDNKFEFKLTLSLREAIDQKIPEFYQKLSKNRDPPPPYCIYEILIQIFYRKFRDKIKMWQNSVNNESSEIQIFNNIDAITRIASNIQLFY